MKYSDIWEDKDKIIRAAKKSESIAEMLTILKIPRNSGNYQTLKSKCLLYNISIPKMTGRSLTKQANIKNKIPNDKIFSNRGIKTSSNILIKRLCTEYSFPYICSECGQEPFWNNKKLVLELDHINGNSFDNTIENLRILCGHCHSQTENFRGRNTKNKIYNYCVCGKKMNNKSKLCYDCYIDTTKLSKIKYGSVEEVHNLYKDLKTFVALGKHFNVTDNAVRKYIKSCGITIDDFKKGFLV